MNAHKGSSLESCSLQRVSSILHVSAVHYISPYEVVQLNGQSTIKHQVFPEGDTGMSTGH